LDDVSAASKLPRGAVLCAEPLRTAVKAKLKAPRLAVRTASVARFRRCLHSEVWK